MISLCRVATNRPGKGKSPNFKKGWGFLAQSVAMARRSSRVSGTGAAGKSAAELRLRSRGR